MIINAAVGFILKSFLVVPPIFTIYFQLRFVFVESDQDLFFVRKCRSDYFCSTIETIGRNFMLVNLTIPFFFYYKFDKKFNECLKNLIENLKKKMKQSVKNNVFLNNLLSKFFRM